MIPVRARSCASVAWSLGVLWLLAGSLQAAVAEPLAVAPGQPISSSFVESLEDPAPYLERAHGAQLILGIFYGILVGTILSHLILLFSVRQAVYFYLIGHTVSLGLIFACYDGLALQQWPQVAGWLPWAMLGFVGQLNVFTVLFVRRVVDSVLAYPGLDRWLRQTLGALVVSSALVGLGGIRAFFWVNIFWFLVVALGSAVLVAWHARRHRPARIYAFAWGLIFIVMAAAVAASRGLIANSLEAGPAVRILVLVEVLLATMAASASLTETRRALAVSEDKLSGAFLASPDAITISTLAEGRFLEVNDSFEKVSGYSREEALGRTSGELGIWEREGRARLLAALQRHGRLEELEGHIIRKSGRKCPIRFSAAPIEVEGEPCLVAIVQDTSLLEQATRQRESLIRRLEAQNAELERFAYTVSHDLKGPLISIGGLLGFLEKEALEGNTSKIRHYAARIGSATQHMFRLLDDLLDLSRIGRVANPVEEVPLGELAGQASEQLTEQLRRKNVDLEIAPDLPTVRGDRTRLLEILQNLLENAVKFLGDQAEPRIDIGCRREGAEIVCYVRDNGIGIEPHYHDKIFGLFERLSADTEGTGVGLALVRRIIDFHGGRVWVESEGRGSGACFCFVLPPAGSAADGGSAPNPAAIRLRPRD